MPELTNLTTDEAIVRQVQLGDSEAFGILVKRYEIKILHYARKFLFNYTDIEDLAQDVFIKAYNNIQSFDASRKFSAWIYRIAHNEFINAIKKKGREPVSYFDVDVLWPRLVSREKADHRANEQELRKMLDYCLNELDLKYREPLILYYLEELDYQEIADILHIPVSTVGVRLRRGREKMKWFCQKSGYHYEQ
ncbi:MAG: RNA polymerase sigma factor [Parcubacteria group bacterium GW2011_GWF2_44_7]|nr:MAG: RNA polymerase sigma factor [Parcubacteria group bacterium GW2011_GWF2_44_7]